MLVISNKICLNQYRGSSTELLSDVMYLKTVQCVTNNVARDQTLRAAAYDVVCVVRWELTIPLLTLVGYTVFYGNVNSLFFNDVTILSITFTCISGVAKTELFVRTPRKNLEHNFLSITS